MNLENQENTETQEDFDMVSAAADISAELFGQGDSGETQPTKEKSPEGEGSDVSANPEGVETQTPPQPEGEKKPEGEAKAEGEQTQAAEEVAAPKTWTKEAAAEWSNLSPTVKAEIAKREEDFLKGISTYKEAAELGARYDQVTIPYRPILAAENVDPVQLFQAFSANHYLLSRGTPEQKIQVAAHLVKSYGIDLNKLNEAIGDQIDEPIDPNLAAVQKELADLKASLQSRQVAEQTELRSKVESDIEAFAKDRPYFEELSEDIAALLESGLAKDLPDAYERALYANPETRQKELSRLEAEKANAAAAEEKKRAEKNRVSTGDHIHSDPTPRNGVVPLGTMDETLKATLESINSRG